MAKGDAPSEGRGLVIEGTFLGVKAPEPYEIDGRTGTSNPKVGFQDAEGNVYRVTVSADTFREWGMAERGSLQVMPVIARPPFRQGQPIRFTDRTMAPGRDDWE